MMKRFLLLALMIAPLAACGTLKDTFGFTKRPPDEFQVITKAPLVIPPDFTLRPPRTSEAAQVQFSSSLAARNLLFGDTGANEPASLSEKNLLARAGAEGDNSEIRLTIDNESRQTKDAQPSLIERLSFGLIGGK